MGGRAFWYIPDKIYIAHYYGVLTMAELHKISGEGRDLVRAGGNPVHLIIDMRFLIKYPTDVHEILRGTKVFREEKLGWAVLISSDPVVRLLTHIVTALTKKDLRVFQTPQDALRFLQQVDPDITEFPEYPIQTESDRTSAKSSNAN